jgi:hypothetical protein
MESIDLIQALQERYRNKLLLTGLAALQSPAVQTKQLTFLNPAGGKEDYFIGRHHVLIRRSRKKSLTTRDHLLFIARHIELYADEIDQLAAILPDIPLADLRKNDKAWRIFAYLKKHILGEEIPGKKSIGRRMIDIGDVTGAQTVRDNVLHVRDGLLILALRRKRAVWIPRIEQFPDPIAADDKRLESERYFKKSSIRPLFHKFCRYASRLESAASAKIEGYDARINAAALGAKMQQRMKRNLALRANLNMDNLHRDIVQLSREPFSIDFLCRLQEAIVAQTWRDDEEKADQAPGALRPFDEVIVDRAQVGRDNVVYVAPKHTDVRLLLQELIDFYHRKRNATHPLDLAALFKCQLVVIHPFGDGNGRLARWCFQSILIREQYLESVHQAPLSHIFLEEKNRYYNELARVDGSVMKAVAWEIDPTSRRYRAIYDDPGVYRSLDYSSWLAYAHDAFLRAIDFSMEEHAIFERTERILEAFEKGRAAPLDAGQRHESLRAIDIGLRHEWGKKTEKRLHNNGLTDKEIARLRTLVHKRAK